MIDQISKSYQNGMDSLDDLTRLGPTELYPLITNVSYHLNELRTTVTDNLYNENGYPHLKSFIKNWMEESTLGLQEKLSLNQLNIHYSEEDLLLSSWDKVMGVWPTFISLLEVMPFEADGSLLITKDKILFEGHISKDSDLLAIRDQVYALTRLFLKKKSLLTFEEQESAREESYKLRLVCNFGHIENNVYAVPLDKQHTQFLGFSNLFDQFKINLKQAKNLGKHTVIMIDEDFGVHNLDQIPEGLTPESFNGEFIHFAFLFRPVSLIIFSKGTLQHRNEFGLDKTTGCEVNRNQQEVENSVAKTFRYIDFFSLVSR